jgi:hypothetical protein
MDGRIVSSGLWEVASKFALHILSCFPETTHGCCWPSPGAGNSIFSSDSLSIYFLIVGKYTNKLSIINYPLSFFCAICHKSAQINK